MATNEATGYRMTADEHVALFTNQAEVLANVQNALINEYKSITITRVKVVWQNDMLVEA